MKFPRNARIFRGQLDAAPFLSVFFLLVIFVLLGSLVYTPGVRVQLPVSDGGSGVAGPTAAVAIDANGQYFFRNQLVDGTHLLSGLKTAVSNSPEPLTLIVQADRETKRESLDQLAAIAKEAGIRELLLATLPRP
ncbi:MAG TPA: biopolymer transporter ExbD [Verrucomicrobiae bacterium]|nr:biopolymer transporter ExbD [Verrucomicrobiae bacterium]